MTRHDIPLRRQTISSGRIHQHKNYQQLLQRQRRTSRLRLILYFLVAMLVIALAYGFIYYSSEKAIKTEDTERMEPDAIVTGTVALTGI